jgi:predicted component of type VI protein secretion system
MPKLFINPSSPAVWEIQLKPGPNRLGRGAANDFMLTDPAVSGSHCEILVAAQSVVIKDLGSTNGTFVNRAPVREAVLQEGDRIHLGGVEMVYAAEKAAAPAQGGTEAAPARPVSQSQPRKVVVARVVAGPAPGPAVVAPPPAPPRPAP